MKQNSCDDNIEDLKKYIPAGVLDPAHYDHELQAPEAKYKLARAVLQEIPRQVKTNKRLHCHSLLVVSIFQIFASSRLFNTWRRMELLQEWQTFLTFNLFPLLNLFISSQSHTL